MSSISRLLKRVWDTRGAALTGQAVPPGLSPVEEWFTKWYLPPRSSWAQLMERLATTQLSDPESGYVEIYRETDVQSEHDSDNGLSWPDDAYFFTPPEEE